MAKDLDPSPCVVLTLSEAWRIRAALVAIEKQNVGTSFQQGPYDALTVLEKAMGYPPKRDLYTAIWWDKQRPGDDFAPEELEWREKMRVAYEGFDPLRSS